MAVKASNQLSVLDLTDGFTVILTNESHTFIGDENRVKGTQVTTTQVMVFRGSEQLTCKIGAMTPPTGISAVSDGKAQAPVITITATSALTKGGSFTIPVEIEGGITINKTFSFAIAFAGAHGSNGNGIKTTVITYQAGTSGTTPPTGTWNKDIPSVPAGQFLWTKTVTTYTDGSDTTAYSVGKMGNTGGTGNGIESTAITYQVGTSGTTPPTGQWATSIPNVPAGKYLWTKTVNTYTNGSTSTAYSVGRMGSDGKKGEAGIDAITLVIESSAGIIFKNTAIATVLTAHVYKGGQEITGTALTALGTIKWYKDESTTPVATGQNLTVEAGDVTNKATYTAKLEG